MQNRLTLRFPGRCASCNTAIAAGVTVFWDRATRAVQACPDCNDELANATPVQATSLQVTVTQVIFQRDDFAICMVTADLPPAVTSKFPLSSGVPFPAKGQFGAFEIGSTFDVEGMFEYARNRWTLAARKVVPAVPASAAGLAAFLQRLPGIGPSRAGAIVRYFQHDDLLQVLEEAPERLAAVRGITEEMAQEIGECYRDTVKLRESMLFLAELDLGPQTDRALLDTWGADLKAKILRDPYVVMEVRGFGFQRADLLRHAVNRYLVAAGQPIIADDDPRVVRAFTRELLDRAEAEGHVWSTAEELFVLTRA